jgi:hypothetical protein
MSPALNALSHVNAPVTNHSMISRHNLEPRELFVIEGYGFRRHIDMRWLRKIASLASPKLEVLVSAPPDHIETCVVGSLQRRRGTI